MPRRNAHCLTSIGSVLGMLLVVAAHGGFFPRLASADSKNCKPQTNTPRQGEDSDKTGDGDTSEPLDLIDSLPCAMLIRIHTDEPSAPIKIRISTAASVVACGGLDPVRRGTAVSSAPGGAYRLLSLRKDAYLARSPVSPFAETPAPRDPALISSISILGPPSA